MFWKLSPLVQYTYSELDSVSSFKTIFCWYWNIFQVNMDIRWMFMEFCCCKIEACWFSCDSAILVFLRTASYLRIYIKYVSFATKKFHELNVACIRYFPNVTVSIELCSKFQEMSFWYSIVITFMVLHQMNNPIDAIKGRWIVDVYRIQRLNQNHGNFNEVFSTEIHVESHVSFLAVSFHQIHTPCTSFYRMKLF